MPGPAHESAVARHDRMVREEKEQADAVATLLPPGDIWQGMAGRFRPRPESGEDPTLPFLLALIERGDRVIDVGAGGGRLALPLTRSCRELVAVEPSAAMRGVLSDECARQGIQNLVIVADRWEEAEVGAAEVVFSANVTYGVLDIAPFLRRMDEAATRHAVLMVNVEPPQAPLAPFWRAVYGTERLRLPCSDELGAVLRELGAAPEVTELPSLPAQPLGDRDEALAELRRRLFVAPESAGDERLQAALDTIAERRDGVYWPPDARPRERRMIRWTPRGLDA